MESVQIPIIICYYSTVTTYVHKIYNEPILYTIYILYYTMKVSGCCKVLDGLIYHELTEQFTWITIRVNRTNTFSFYVAPVGFMWSGWPLWFLGFSFFHHFCTLGVRDTLSWDIGIPFIIIIRRFLCGSNGLTLHTLCVLMNTFYLNFAHYWSSTGWNCGIHCSLIKVYPIPSVQ